MSGLDADVAALRARCVNPWQVAQQAAGYVRASQEAWEKARTFAGAGMRPLQRAAEWDRLQGSIKLAGEQARELFEQLDAVPFGAPAKAFVQAVIDELARMYREAGNNMRADLAQLLPELGA